MAPEGLHTYFDDPSQFPEKERDRELARLLDQVADLGEHDPGPEYWSTFNQRIQQRLQQTKQPESIFSAIRRFWMMGALAAAAAALIIAFWPVSTQSPSDHLEGLSDDALMSVAMLYDEDSDAMLNEPGTDSETLLGLENWDEPDLDLYIQAYSQPQEADYWTLELTEDSDLEYLQQWNSEG